MNRKIKIGKKELRRLIDLANNHKTATFLVIVILSVVPILLYNYPTPSNNESKNRLENNTNQTTTINNNITNIINTNKDSEEDSNSSSSENDSSSSKKNTNDIATKPDNKNKTQIIEAEHKTASRIKGSWGLIEYCEPGSFAYKFQLEIEPYQGKRGPLPGQWAGKNDSAVNVIRLFCKDLKTGKDTNTITSSGGTQGREGRQEYSCDTDQYLFWYQSLIETSSKDISGYNGIIFGCRKHTSDEPRPEIQIEDEGLGYGTWTEKAAYCDNNGLISGIQTRVGDSRVAVINVRFICSNPQEQIL